MFFDFTYFRSLEQKTTNNFVHFLIQIRTRKFTSEIYQRIEGQTKAAGFRSISKKVVVMLGQKPFSRIYLNILVNLGSGRDSNKGVATAQDVS